MALFQYFFQKLHEIFDGAALFSEWRPYAAFQLFCCALFFPALKRLKYNRIWKGILFAAAMLVLMVMYPDVFAGTLIDPVMCAMAGAGFVYLFICKDIPLPEKTVYTGMPCSLLVLMKDAGLFFGAFVAVAFAVYVLAERTKTKKWKSAIVSTIPLLSALAAKGSWKLVLNRFQTPIAFSQPLRIGEFLKIFFVGGDTTYRQETVDLFKAAMTNTGIYKLHEGITTSYLIALIVLLAGLAGLTVLWIRKTKETRKNNLSEYHSRAPDRDVHLLPWRRVYLKVQRNRGDGARLLRPLCAHRYSPAVPGAGLDGPFPAAGSAPGLKEIKSLSAVLCAGVVLLCSFEWLWGFVSRKSVQDTVANREPYRAVQQTVETECSGEEERLLLPFR